MTEPRELPTRKETEAALRALGFSHRVARRFVAVAWPAVVGEVQAERDALRDEIEQLRAALRR